MKASELIKILEYVQEKYPKEEIYCMPEFSIFLIEKANGELLYDWESDEVNSFEEFLSKEEKIRFNGFN